MDFLGYGEDSVTLWALVTRLDEVLSQLNDGALPESCTVLYRPSFGRGRGANFGEFDAIIITPRTAYLIESKWDGSNASYPHNVLELTPSQTLRHRIFEWYHEKWKGQDWTEFAREYAVEFKAQFSKNIAPAGRLLSQNLMTVLELTRGKNIEDVLLYLFRRVENIPNMERIPFRKVRIEYTPTREYVKLPYAKS